MLIAGLFGALPMAHSQGSSTFEPLLSLRYGYNSNIRLTAADQIDTPEAIVDTGFRFKRNTETSALSSEFHLRNLNYARADFANSDDLTADISYSSQGELFGGYVAGSAARENVITTELEDSGIVAAGVQRERLIGSSGMSFQTGEKTLWTLDASYENTGFSGSSRFVDYDYEFAQLSRTAQLNARSSLIVRADYGNFETDDGFTESQTYGVNVGFERQSSETFSWHMGIGRNHTRSRDTFGFFGVFLVEVSEDDGWNADFGFRKAWERSSLNLNAGQAIRPSGQGALTTRRFVQLSYRHDLGEFVAARLSGGLRRFDDTSDLNRTNNDRTVAQASLAFDFDLSRRWSINFEATHRTQEFDRRMDIARGEIVSLTLRYVPRRDDA